jgi:hypothetical protein
MPWPVHPNGLLGAQGDNDTYKIERSLRFNSADSAYLSRTPSVAGNRKTWTWSGWVKRSALSGTIQLIESAGTATSTETTRLYFGFGGTENFIIGYGGADWRATTQLFRDISSWYHIVVAFDSGNATALERIKLYVNGSQITSFSTTNTVTLNTDGALNNNIEHFVGRDSAANQYYFNGYLTEINFIDGQALTPSSFGETDAITGRWKAKAYSGTYGTNGFYLKFADNSGTTATTLGKDSSPNGNNWTPNNFSVTAGAGNDSLVDSPTNYGSDTGVGGEARGNYCTLNPLFGTTNTIQDGALVLTGTAAGSTQRVGTMAVSSGKWYYEVTLTTLPTGMDPLAGFTEINNASAVSQYPGQASSSYSIYQISSNTFLQKVNANTFTNTNTAVASQGDILGVALDLSSGKIWFSKNGTYVDSGNPATGANAQFTGLSGTFVPAVRGTGGGTTTTITCNFGQRPFAYTAPTGFKALCTTNLPTPTIKKPSSYMDAVTFTATGSDQTITGFNFSPDLVWIKNRANWAGNRHTLYDTTRGAQQRLDSSTTEAEAADNDLTAFNSNGFSGNLSGTTYVAWAWDESPIAGMDIVSFVSPSGTTQSTVAHNLGVAPKMIIAKNRDTNANNWAVFHSSVCDTTSKFLQLNTTAALQTFATVWGASLPTSSVFGVTGGGVAASGVNCIAYCFAEVEGFSKFGSYTGNGSADGPFVFCGFRPRWVMFKRTDTAGGGWNIRDTSRNTQNSANLGLFANLSNAESTQANIDILSNGLKMRDAGGAETNASGGTYIFAAFAESPFKYARAR